MQPAIFVSHGAPTLAIDDNPASRFLSKLGNSLEKPEAILVISAHWMTRNPAVSAVVLPETIHDFGGFPAELYKIEYPAPGAPELSKRIYDLLRDSSMDCDISSDRGLDHGAWVPLSLMYPNADIPVTQLSIQYPGTTKTHFEIGRALAPLRQEGVLILASGGAVHNLGALTMSNEPDEWARRFDNWLYEKLMSAAFDDLINYRTLNPDGRLAHPTEDHFFPLFVAMGAAGAGHDNKVESLHRSWTYGNLSMAAYGFTSVSF